MKQFVVVLVDLAIIYGCIWMSFKLLDNNLLDYNYNLQAFQIIAPLIGVLYFILMYAFGLYNFPRRKLQDVVYTVFLITVSLAIGIMAICFFVRGGALAFPRSVIFLSMALYGILLMIWRTFVWKMVKKAHGVRTVAVVGPDAQVFANVLHAKHRDIYNVKHICSENDSLLLEKIKDSEDVFLTTGISNKIREMILLFAAERESDVYFVPEYRDISIMSSSLQKTDDIPTYHISKVGLSFEERIVKRFLDLLLGTIGLALASPLILLCTILVKLDGGSVFYTQERLTRKGKVFRVFKFRTMVPNAEKLSGPVLAGQNDPRITRIGHFMRATRMDEIPQILNILNGDMSIVGPRPERPFFTEQFEKQIPHYRQRLKVKAGLTGLAQVEGKYNTSFEDKLRYDLIYINNYSLFQDLLIILQTVKILFMKESTEGVDHSNNVLVPSTENKQIQHETSPIHEKTISISKA